MLHKKRILTTVLCFLLLAALPFSMTGCAGNNMQAANLMEGVNTNGASGKAADDRFIRQTAGLSLRLFQKSIVKDKNSLISPILVLLSLAMTANGAQGQTKAELEALLGGGIPLGELNAYLYAYVNGLPSADKETLRIANSIWFRKDNLTVEPNFLQTNADYYGAAAFQSAFDGQTLQDINQWTKEHTDGMIDQILDQIDPDAVMYLINAMAFDAEWESGYQKNDISEGTFAAVDGADRSVKLMRSKEGRYINDGNATGFVKNYKNGHYSFAALLPDENVSIEAYIASLTGEGLLQAVNNAESAPVTAALPKFTCEYTVQLNSALKALGIPTAFDSGKADFSALGKASTGNIYMEEVLHKAYLSVDERGTKAGASTKVEMQAKSASPGYTVTLDRPFVYAILDNATGLPLFLGTVMDVQD